MASNNILKAAEIAMAPHLRGAGFRTIERDGIFYTDRPSWARYGVHSTATSEAGARANIAADISSWIAKAKQDRLVWC